MTAPSFPSYSKFVGLGLRQDEADRLDAARQHGQIAARSIPIGDHDLEAVMMGVLDVAIGSLVRAYGTEKAAAMMDHYAATCRRNADKAPSHGG